MFYCIKFCPQFLSHTNCTLHALQPLHHFPCNACLLLNSLVPTQTTITLFSLSNGAKLREVPFDDNQSDVAAIRHLLLCDDHRLVCSYGKHLKVLHFPSNNSIKKDWIGMFVPVVWLRCFWFNVWLFLFLTDEFLLCSADVTSAGCVEYLMCSNPLSFILSLSISISSSFLCSSLFLFIPLSFLFVSFSSSS